MSTLKKTVKIIALPYAGGSKYCYRDFEALIPDEFEWITFELPGRGNRINEDFFMNVEDMVDDLFAKIIPIVKSSEYILYGHSLGTILGYELMKKIVAYNIPEPAFLFFTGRGSPSVREKDKLADLEEKLFWKKVMEIGGMPKEILKNDELKDFFGPIIRSDFRAVENYKFIGLDKPFQVPLYIGLGNEELIGKENDKVKWRHILDWQKIVEDPIDVKFYKGDHFFIVNNTQVLIEEIVNAFAMCKKRKVIVSG